MDDNTPANDGKVVIGTSMEVDNLKLDGTTLSTSNVNGNLVLSAHGNGAVVAQASSASASSCWTATA